MLFGEVNMTIQLFIAITGCSSNHEHLSRFCQGVGNRRNCPDTPTVAVSCVGDSLELPETICLAQNANNTCFPVTNFRSLRL